MESKRVVVVVVVVKENTIGEKQLMVGFRMASKKATTLQYFVFIFCHR